MIKTDLVKGQYNVVRSYVLYDISVKLHAQSSLLWLWKLHDAMYIREI